MSWQASGWAKKCRAHSPTHKLVLLVTADYATDKAGAIGVHVPDGQAVCWAGIDEIAVDCDMSPRTVIRVLADLETGGFIRRDRRYGRNPRAGLPGQPNMVRTTDAIWFDYSRPYVTAPPNEAKQAAKARAGRLGGKVSAARRSAEREAARAAHDTAATALFGALAEPPEAVPQVTACSPLGDNVLGPQVTPSFTAEPTTEPPINRQERRAPSASPDRAREAPEQDQPMPSKTAGPPAGAPPTGPSRPRHANGRTAPLRRRRAWVDDGAPEPARYRRPPTPPDGSDP